MRKVDHGVFILVTFLYWFSLYIYVPILTPYLEWMGSNYTYIGIVLASYGIIQMLIRLPLGIYSDYLKVRRPFIALGFITSAISCFGFVVLQQAEWALLSRAISGITASTWVAFTVLYSSYYAQQTAKAMANIQFVTVVTQLISMGLSGYLVSKMGWHAPFWLGGIVALIGLLLTFFIKEPAEGVSRPPIQLKELALVLKDSTLIKVSILSILAHGILFVTMFGFTPSYALTIGASEQDLSLLILSFMAPHAIAALLAGRVFVAHLGKWGTLILGFLGSSIFSSLIPIMPSLGWLCLSQAFNGFFQGILFPLFLSMAIESIESEKRATAMGFYQAVYSLGMFMGPFLAGWLIEHFGLNSGFQVAGISGLIALGFSIYWAKQYKDSVVLNQSKSV